MTRIPQRLWARLKAAARHTDRDRARLLQLVDASTDFISLASLDTRLMYMNRSARLKLGLTPDEDIRQLHLQDYVAEEQRKFLDDMVLRTARAQGLWEGEMQLQHLKTGERIDVFRRTFLIRHPLTGKPDCYATVNQDISEFKRKQAILRDNKDRMSIALEAARAGIFDMNVETREVQWSDEHFTLLGLPAPGEASYSLWRKHMHRDDFGRVAAEVQRTIDTGERFVSEYRMVGASGEVLWVLAQAVILQRPGQARHLVGAIVDISRLKQAEAEAQASERRFRIMADGAPANIWVSNAQGELEFVNREYCNFFGKTLEETKKEGWQQVLHPEDAAGYLSNLSMALANRDSFRARTRVRHTSDDWRWLECSAVPRFSETGTFLGHVGLGMDVTELVQSQRALQEADRRKDEFLAILSHELRNPLAPIRNAAAILASPKLTPEQMRWARSVIERQTDTMSRLLEDLLNVARIAEGKLTLRSERVALTRIVDAAIESARPLIDRKHHKLTVNLPSEALTIQADPLRLSQVIGNLLTNSAKYTDPGGHIALTARRQDGALEITVKDNGIGIPPDALNRIFAMFEQAKGATSRSEGGLGIGLALVKGLVALHGGTVKVHSEGVGRGSEFTIALPLASVAPGPARTSIERPTSDATPQLRVLVADDNVDAADSLAVLLTLAGHQVRVAHGGPAAVSLSQLFHPQVALLDLGMPEIDGYDVARSLRSEPWGEDLYIIALTGWGQEEHKRKAQTAGFDAHLTKPVDPDALMRLLAQVQRGSERHLKPTMSNVHAHWEHSRPQP